jgi:hypothetical protein
MCDGVLDEETDEDWGKVSKVAWGVGGFIQVLL